MSKQKYCSECGSPAMERNGELACWNCHHGIKPERSRREERDIDWSLLEPTRHDAQDNFPGDPL